MKDTNQYKTRSDGMHYRQAWGRTIDIVDLDEGRPGTVRFDDGSSQECIAFKCGSGRTFLWIFELKDPCRYAAERGKAFQVDVEMSGSVLRDLTVYGLAGTYQIHSRDRFKN